MHELINKFWLSTSVPHGFVGVLTAVTHLIVLLVICGVAYWLCRKVLSPLIRRFVVYTAVKWDDIMFNASILKAISLLIVAILLHVLTPEAMVGYPKWGAFFRGLTEILLVWAVCNLINKALSALYELLGQDSRIRMQPLKGLLQMLQLICITVGVIISISIIINRNPATVLAGLGASAAVLMLVFKDTILGVVAGVQLSANDMLRKGDWIVVPGTPVNGTVQDVTLTTVKVQNFDNTTLTVPPYTLISGSFQNWRGMSDSGGRRIMRSVIIDFRSVRFLTADEKASFASADWFGKVTDGIDKDIVNLTAFRYYLEDFIEHYSLTKTEYTFMVRQLEPTDQGVPVQVYAFTNQTDWKTYEHIQADIFDHIYATVGTFGLRIYQAPSADDLRALAKGSPVAEISSGASCNDK